MSREREGTPYADERLSFDIRETVRSGGLPPNSAGIMQWRREPDDEPSATAGVAMIDRDGTRALTLCYQWTRPGGGEPHVVRERLALEATPCHFGGQRWWVLCPVCWQRVAKLYCRPRDGRFVCRTCAGVAYRVTRMSERDRIDRRRLHLADRLGYPRHAPRDHIPWRYLDRPAGMRPETFRRLKDDGELLELRSNILWTDRFRRLLARSDRRLARGGA